MTEQRIRIEKVLVKDIIAFAARYAQAHAQGKVVPISKLRAAAHAANPVADGDDVCLLVAMQGDDVVGYVGLMPSMLEVDGKLRKLYWYTTWYSGASGQQAGAGGILLHASLALGYDIVATDLADITIPYYRKLRFKPLGPLTYFELNLDRLDPIGAPWLALRVFLRRRGRNSTLVDRAFAACRSLSKSIFYGLIGSTVLRIGRNVIFRELSELPDELSPSVGSGTSFYRGPEVVRWRLTYPWISEQPEEATEGFYFSDYREMVRFVILELRSSEGSTYGCVILSISRHRGRTTVKVLDRFVRSAEEPRLLVAAGLAYAKRYRADRLTLPEQCEPFLQKSVPLRWMMRSRSRLYFCHPSRNASVLPTNLEDIQLDFCDGDTPFT
jgi:hypothetical protein